MGIKETELEGSIRPVDWLRINGKCLDNLRPGVSNIEGAGRGAFATRFIPQGDLVAPAPLIHIPYKEAVLMHSPSKGIVDDDGFDVWGERREWRVSRGRDVGGGMRGAGG